MSTLAKFGQYGTLFSLPPKRACVATIILICVASVVIASAQTQLPQKPLSKDDVVTLLKGGVSTKRVEAIARERGIDFQITPEVETELHAAGATDTAIGLLREIAPKPSALIITTQPGGAQVFLDDELIARTSTVGRLKISNLPAGSHKLRVSLNHYREQEQAIKLESAKTLEIRVSLELATTAGASLPSGEVSSGSSDTPETPQGANMQTAGVATYPKSTPGVGESMSRWDPPGVLYEVWHRHGNPWSYVISKAKGTLRVSNAGLEFNESGKHSEPDHNFKAPCSEVIEAGPISAFTYGGGWFHIRLPRGNFNLLGVSEDGPDPAMASVIMEAISSACRLH